jgi:SAM-dependent methyltransferase
VQLSNYRIFRRAHQLINHIFGKDLDYKDYWHKIYLNGETSGPGSYGELAEFKAEVINEFLEIHEISSVIEFGCGDGNQLSMIQYPKYLGLDVAKSSIDLCFDLFKNDPNKSFLWYQPGYLLNPALFLKADLVVCLDVLYHIIDDEDFENTLKHIFSCASKHVILYTTIDVHDKETYAYFKGSHGKHRDTMHYLSMFPDFKVEKTIPQKHPDLSSASFIFLTKEREAQNRTSRFF